MTFAIETRTHKWYVRFGWPKAAHSWVVVSHLGVAMGPVMLGHIYDALGDF